jgi:SOS-response transcriptional repressor LexA
MKYKVTLEKSFQWEEYIEVDSDDMPRWARLGDAFIVAEEKYTKGDVLVCDIEEVPDLP